jgi:hypothetical protein
MARYQSGMTAAGAGTSLRPVFALLNTASVTGMVREIGMFNTTATECVYRLVRITGGTAGADQTEAKHRRSSPAASCVAKGLWTADATVDEDAGYRFELGAAKGSAAILTFGDTGVETHDVGTTKGIGLVPVGTGQVCEVYLVWDE